MKVTDVMVRTPTGCQPETKLREAVELMWNHGCGFLPVLNSEMKVIGVVTDRDLCLALGSSSRLPGDVTVGEVTPGTVYTCKADDDIHVALATMREHRVRRLPVVDSAGRLVGVLSMDNVVLHAETRKPRRSRELTADEVLETLKRVYEPAIPQVPRHRVA